MGKTFYKLITYICLSFVSYVWAIEQNCDSPIIIDLAGDGVRLGAKGNFVFFDMLDTGLPTRIQWVRKGGDEAFLAMDRNRNGLIDNGAELFGNGTDLILEARKAPNGFVGLAQYDSLLLGGNDDGVITSADAIWDELLIWLDINADGQSSINELFLLEDFNLSRLYIIPKFYNRYDSAGNWLPLWAWAYLDVNGTPKKRKMVDVFFKRDSHLLP